MEVALAVRMETRLDDGEDTDQGDGEDDDEDDSAVDGFLSSQGFEFIDARPPLPASIPQKESLEDEFEHEFSEGEFSSMRILWYHQHPQVSRASHAL
jgi:hypothetical protein